MPNVGSTRLASVLATAARSAPRASRSAEPGGRRCAPWPPTAGHALEDMGVVRPPIEQRCDGRGVNEQLAPVVDGPVQREERRGAFVALHDRLQQVLGGRVRQLAHAGVVDDQQGHPRQLPH